MAFHPIIIVLIILLLLGGGLGPWWGYSAQWGYRPVGGVGLLLVILILILLLR